MNDHTFESFFGQTIECGCGKTHRIEPRLVIYENGALRRLPAVLAEFASGRRVAIVMDARTRTVAGAAAAELLKSAGWTVGELVVPDPAEGGTPVCDGHTHDALLNRLDSSDVILTVGSGVVNDLGKWIAFDRNLPHICFGTAASMNGYASANVAVAIDGVKSLIWARPARAILADPAILRDAPFKLITAGLGDVLAKSVSSADWRLNNILFGDYFCERSVSLIADIEPLYVEHPDGIRELNADAIEALFRALLLTGVAMTMAGTSSPASGGEHLISHTLDMMSSLDDRGDEPGIPPADGLEQDSGPAKTGSPKPKAQSPKPSHDLHGRQVGVGTIIASEIYRRVIAIESPRFTRETAGVDPAFWGRLTEGVQSFYADKPARIAAAVTALSTGNTWDRLRESIAPMLRPPEQIRECLRRAGAAWRAEDLGCSRERLLDALLNAHVIRPRFTVLDLARVVGVLPREAEEIVEGWG